MRIPSLTPDAVCWLEEQAFLEARKYLGLSHLPGEQEGEHRIEFLFPSIQVARKSDKKIFRCATYYNTFVLLDNLKKQVKQMLFYPFAFITLETWNVSGLDYAILQRRLLF